MPCKFLDREFYPLIGPIYFSMSPSSPYFVQYMSELSNFIKFDPINIHIILRYINFSRSKESKIKRFSSYISSPCDFDKA